VTNMVQGLGFGLNHKTAIHSALPGRTAPEFDRKRQSALVRTARRSWHLVRRRQALAARGGHGQHHVLPALLELLTEKLKAGEEMLKEGEGQTTRSTSASSPDAAVPAAPRQQHLDLPPARQAPHST
jgi:hypothetical protein